MIDDIIWSVCEYYKIDWEMLVSGDSADAMMARQVAIYLCRRVGNASLSDIAARFGKTYATLLHAVKVTEKRMSDDSAFKQTVQQIADRM